MIFACPHCHAKLADRSVRSCPTCKRAMTRHCPFCAEDISILATVCKYCGENAPPVAAAAAAPAKVAVVEESVEVRRPAKADIEFVGNVKSVPWEDRAAGGWFRRSWKTWAASQFSPAAFWQRTPPDTGHVRAINYAWVLRTQVMGAFGALALVATVALFNNASTGVVTFLIGGAILSLMIPALFMLTAVDVWVRAALWHLPLKVLGGKGDYQTTVRTVAYNSGSDAWLALPVVGLVPAVGFGYVSDVCALREVHRMSAFRAFVGAALPLALKVGIVVAAFAWVNEHPFRWGC